MEVKTSKKKAEQPYRNSIGVMDIINTEFEYWELVEPWAEHLGKPAKNFKMMVYGHPKNGKTSYLMQLTKYLATFTTVYYNSIEEGKSQTLKESLLRHNLKEVAGKWMLGNRDTYQEMVAKLKRPGSPRVVVIDSRDYMNLTTEQYKRLEKQFPKKAFIIVCWEQAGKPAGKYARDIEYMMDIVVHVENFKAKAVSRFGGFGTFTIWNRKPKTGEQLTLITH
ncbi:hypothetical protein [Rufibacter quisquiliarum]|uniref:Putative ATP-dependent serine protease n=1 Tax=Rufibacter quisquiliarum TaxID=1549639 RepID=A0A839GJZ2_9BACT|nr:hypothetical protein [Rufibacter quisquiliarum]MBA9078970.1 putative ATP-dependent serine protease [Rufibacter quisquiliarum]